MSAERGARSFATACAVALVASACGTPTNKCGPTSGTVVNVVDGDTLDLGSGERIRLLNVDTPETTGGKNDCYGQQAKTFTSDTVLNKTVTIVYDAECTDRYGRLLAYVSVGAVELNHALVEQGYACEYTLPPSGATRRTEFEDLESVAKTNRTGLWGACTTVTCGQ